MADGRSVFLWNHTASVMTLLANVHRSKGRAARIADFHPHAKSADVPKSNVTVAQLSSNLMAMAEAARQRGKR